jgi:hypothetical protein
MTLKSKIVTILVCLFVFGILLFLKLPDFLGIQSLHKSNRSINRLRTIQEALYLYKTDFNAYPIVSGATLANQLVNNNYLKNYYYRSNLMEEADRFLEGTLEFNVESMDSVNNKKLVIFYDPFAKNKDYFRYIRFQSDYFLIGRGPDQTFEIDDTTLNNLNKYSLKEKIDMLLNFSYDPTNGVYSRGDIIAINTASNR